MAHKKETYKDELYGDAVREKIHEFAEQGYESIPEDEREAWFSRFKFCGVFHQRDGQDGYFMMRLTNCNGRLQPGQLRAIGERPGAGSQPRVRQRLDRLHHPAVDTAALDRT